MKQPADDSRRDAGHLVDETLRLTGWTVTRFAYEVRATARSLKEAEPTGLDAETVNRWRRRRQIPGRYYLRLLWILHAAIEAELALARTEAASDAEAVEDPPAVNRSVPVRRERRSLVLRILNGLARLLPANERTRFVAEAQGNLGDCDRRWQRVDHLVGLTLGTPRLGWMMWREGRRGRV